MIFVWNSCGKDVSFGAQTLLGHNFKIKRLDLKHCPVKWEL
jgi:hypothetical protein